MDSVTATAESSVPPVGGASPIFTERAAQRVNELIAAEGNPELRLRVFITGGGCAGFQYGFTFDELTAEDDTLLEKGGVGLLIDAMSFPYLSGAQIDFREDLQGSRFLVDNPNATTTCGCGSSFSL